MEKVLVKTLLDKAKEITSSDYKTAKALGVTSQTLSDWRHGRRPVPPEDIALLAAVAGMDPTTWLVRGILEKHAGTKKGERLANVLGKASRAIGEAIALNGVGAMLIYSVVKAIPHSTMYSSVL